jgi:hypothetical protein
VTATQLPESFVLTRSSLEYAGYALHIHMNRTLGETWLRRHDDAASMTAVRKAFQAASIEKTIADKDAKLGEIYKQLYQSTIDFGGHPNERGVSTNLLQQDQAFLGIYLHANELAIANCFKSVALTGLTCLNIFQHIFEARFSLLGLKERLFALRTCEQQFIAWLQKWEISNKNA